MPNKTIYVSEGDLPLYQRAQELAGGNLSAAIASALRRYVDVESGRGEGFDEITVRVGPKAGRKVRFTGFQLGTWGSTIGGRTETINVYRSRSGKFVVHTQRTPDWTSRDAEGRTGGWRSWLGIGEVSWVGSTGEFTLEVVETVDELREKIPPELFEMVASSAQHPAIEDLDI